MLPQEAQLGRAGTSAESVTSSSHAETNDVPANILNKPTSEGRCYPGSQSCGRNEADEAACGSHTNPALVPPGSMPAGTGVDPALDTAGAERFVAA